MDAVPSTSGVDGVPSASGMDLVLPTNDMEDRVHRRRRKIAEATLRRRQAETEEERRRRLAAAAEARRRKRAAESEEERQYRLATAAEAMRRKRAAESEERRRLRLVAEAEAARLKRAALSEEERQQRLVAEANAKRVKRQADAARRQREAEAKRRRRQADSALRQAEAEAKRRRRKADSALRQAEADARRRRRQADSALRQAEAGVTVADTVTLPEAGVKRRGRQTDSVLRQEEADAEGAERHTNIFKRDFLENPFDQPNQVPLGSVVSTSPATTSSICIPVGGSTWEHSDPDQLQIAPGRIRKKRKKNDNGVQDDSEVQESESILPDDGPGWGGSSDESATPVNTIKTEPPDYVEQDEEPGSHLASVKSESEHFEEDWKPNSRVPALTKATELPDYTDMTQVTFHLNAEPQVPEVTRLHGGATVAVKIEPQDATEVCTEAVPVGTDVRDSFAAQQWANVPVNTKLGSDGSSGISAMGAVTIKTEPPEYVEQDEEPGGHLVSVTSEPQCYDDIWKPGNPVPALPKGEPPDYTDATKVTFHTNPVPQVSEGAQQRGNAEVAVKIEPQDPTEVDDQAVSAETGLGAAAPKEFQQDLVPVNPLGSYALMAQPPQWVFPTVSDKAQPQANIIYYHKVEQHGIAMQPVVTTLPVVAVQSVVAAESEQAVVVAVQPQHPAVAPAWLPGSEMGGESGAQQGLSVLLNAGSGTSAASSQEVEQHRVHINPTIPVQPPWHAPSAVCEGVQPQEDRVQFHEFERS